jgi:hypothetical protein
LTNTGAKCRFNRTSFTNHYSLFADPTCLAFAWFHTEIIGGAASVSAEGNQARGAGADRPSNTSSVWSCAVSISDIQGGGGGDTDASTAKVWAQAKGCGGGEAISADTNALLTGIVSRTYAGQAVCT